MPQANDNALSQMKELIYQQYNRASIVMWGVSNEITMYGKHKKDMLAFDKSVRVAFEAFQHIFVIKRLIFLGIISAAGAFGVEVGHCLCTVFRIAASVLQTERAKARL